MIGGVPTLSVSAPPPVLPYHRVELFPFRQRAAPSIHVGGGSLHFLHAGVAIPKDKECSRVIAIKSSRRDLVLL